MSRHSGLLVAFALAGLAAALFGRCAAEPRTPAPPAGWVEVIAAPDADVVVLRSLAKRDIAREAAAGDRSLAEAAALFGELNRLPPVRSEPQCPESRGQTEGERLCRQVISWVRWHGGPGWPEARAMDAAARLEAELDEALARHSTVRLPDAAGLPSAADLVEQARARLTDAERRKLLPGRRGGRGD